MALISKANAMKRKSGEKNGKNGKLEERFVIVDRLRNGYETCCSNSLKKKYL